MKPLHRCAKCHLSVRRLYGDRLCRNCYLETRITLTLTGWLAAR